MKPLCSFTCLLAITLLACNGPAPKANTDSVTILKKEEVMTTTEQNKKAIRSIYDCLNRRSFDELKQYVADDYTGPGGHKGADQFITPVRPVIAAFPDVQWTISDLLAEDDKVAVRWHWRGTFEAPFNSIAPTHQVITNDALAIYQLRDGKAVNVWMQTDRLGFLLQLGIVSPDVVPAPPVRK